MIPLPKPTPSIVPKIQHVFEKESAEAKKIRLHRLELVKSNFTHAWEGYKKHAWLSDEVKPISGEKNDHFGGWAATLVDALDTLLMMRLTKEFEEALVAIDKIDFTNSSLDEINVFETTIRYLGGFLAAHDLSNGKYPALLRKAVELGDMLYHAFDTPNHMPITRWNFAAARRGENQEASDSVLVAEIGSLSLEFTRLSYLSGDPKYFDAVQRITEVFAAQQDHTKIPGLWPVVVDAQKLDFTTHGGFTIGGMADSTFEYLPKEYLLLSGAVPQYRDLYVKALAAMKNHIFFRPNTPDGADILLPGDVDSDGHTGILDLQTSPRVQHLGCFAGGMVGLAARAFDTEHEMETAKKLVEGCLWGYEKAPNGIMPEIMFTTQCPRQGGCVWSEEAWKEGVAERMSKEDKKKRQEPEVKREEEGEEETAAEKLKSTAEEFVAKPEEKPDSRSSDNEEKQQEQPPPPKKAPVDTGNLPKGVTHIADGRYILRPEAIESVFILYRLTGDTSLQDRAWAMFETIVRATQTDIAHAALDDVAAANVRDHMADSMESFWLAETLKYFYLIFETPDVVSLDEYVLNTEAHPLRRAGL